MEIQTYTPKATIVFWDGRKFYIDAEKLETFMADLSEKKFVKIQGVWYAAGNVKEVDPREDQTDAEYVQQLTEPQRKTLEKTVNYYLKNMGKSPAEYTVERWCERLRNGESIPLNF